MESNVPVSLKKKKVLLLWEAVPLNVHDGMKFQDEGA
jgi:hypothetical protein